MLGFFPPPLPDETFFSVLARLQHKLPFISREQLMEMLFGGRKLYISYEFPGCLTYFCSKLAKDSHITPRKILEQHSLWPYYRPFLPTERADKIESMMIELQSSAHLHVIIGVNGSSIRKLKYLRYCRACIEDDRRDFGEAYWHRSHQLQGINTCEKHHLPLTESRFRALTGKLYTFDTTLENAVRKTSGQDQIEKTTDLERFLANSTKWLLESSTPALGFKELKLRYQYFAKKMGCLSSTGVIQLDKFLDRSSACHEKVFFQHNLPWDTWAAISSVKGGDLLTVRPPLWHLVLMYRIGIKPSEFFQAEILSNESVIVTFSAVSEPFGRPPYPCLNITAPHYRQLLIDKVSILKNSKGNPLGRFTCQCGFSYVRVGPDNAPSDKFRFTKVILRGAMWVEKFLEVTKDSNLTLEEKAEKLDVCVGTILRYRNLIKNHGKDHLLSSTCIITLRMERRKKALDIIMMNRVQSRSEFVKIASSLYNWFVSNDREWFNSIANKMFSHGKRRKIVNMDWGKIDTETHEEMRSAIEELKTGGPRPKRITLSALSSKTGDQRILYQIDRMPKTQVLLEQHLESLEEFQIRRVRESADQIRTRNEYPTKSKILLEAHISRRPSEHVLAEIARQTCIQGEFMQT